MSLSESQMQTEQQRQQVATAPEFAPGPQSDESKPAKRGGKRPGAGRKPNPAKRLLKGFSREAIAEVMAGRNRWRKPGQRTWMRINCISKAAPFFFAKAQQSRARLSVSSGRSGSRLTTRRLGLESPTHIPASVTTVLRVPRQPCRKEWNPLAAAWR